MSGQPPMMTHVYLSGQLQLIAAKGAPERILRICKLDEITNLKIRTIIMQMASSGYRVLGVCSATSNIGEYPAEQDDFNWKFEGLLAFVYDPPKKNVNDVFGKWYGAAIDIKLVTGDFAETAMNIAMRTGIRNYEKYVTGEQVLHILYRRAFANDKKNKYLCPDVSGCQLAVN